MDQKQLAVYKHLQEMIVIADAAFLILKNTLEDCVPITEKTKNGEELNKIEKAFLEAFTSRFARASDIFYQKLLRTLDQLELSPEGTMIDRINRAKKRGIFDNQTPWLDLRALRNDIAHEYLINQNSLLLKQALELSPALINAFILFKNYIQNHFSQTEI